MADLVYSLNRFPEITIAMHKALSQIVRETADDGKTNVQAWIQANGQVDTGFMLNSVYTVTSEGSTYQGGEDALPEVEAPPNDVTAYFAVAASYAQFQNYGTRYLPPRPFFEPGVEQTRPDFEEKLSTLEARIGAGI